MTTWDWTSEQWRFLSLCFNSPFPHSWPLPFSKPRSLHGTNACACFLFALLAMCVGETWRGSRTPHWPLYQTIQTSSIQGILLVTPEGLWGLDKLQDLFQRVWLEKWQLSVNSHSLRKQSHLVDDLSACGCHIQWGRQWHPTPVLLPGKSHGWRSLVGCNPWGS